MSISIQNEALPPSLSGDRIKYEFSRRLNLLLDLYGYPKMNYGRHVKLAEDLGVKPDRIYKILNGQLPRPETLQKIVRLFHTTSDFLFGFSDFLHGVEPISKPRNDGKLLKPFKGRFSEIAIPLDGGNTHNLEHLSAYAIRISETNRGLLTIEFLLYGPNALYNLPFPKNEKPDGLLNFPLSGKLNGQN